MAKRKKSLIFSPEKNNSFFSGEESPELLEKLPLLLEEGDIILEQFFNFYRVALGGKKNIIFLSSPEVIYFLRNFLRWGTNAGEQFIGFADSSGLDLLTYWRENLPSKDTTLVVLARPIEELQLLLLAFSFPQWEKVLVGSNYGILAQTARLLFLPFLPTEVYHHYFWQRSALLYLPLIGLRLPVEEMEEGFKDGDYLRKEAAAFSLFIKEVEEKGKEKINFLVDNSFILSVLQCFLPLLEYSCGEKGKVEFRAFNFSMMRENQLFLSDKSIFVLVKGKKVNKIKFNLPATLKKIDLFSQEKLIPASGSWEKIREIEYQVVENKLKKEEKVFLEWEYYSPDLRTAGEIMTLMRYLVSYNAWLRGLDLWSDPPVVDFDNQMWKLLSKREQ